MASTKMTAKDVRRHFIVYWAHMVKANPRLATDRPAKREAFANYVDSLHRDGQISTRTAYAATLE